MTSTPPLPIVRFGFYAFIFAIPIETLDIGIEQRAGLRFKPDRIFVHRGRTITTDGHFWGAAQTVLVLCGLSVCVCLSGDFTDTRILVVHRGDATLDDHSDVGSLLDLL